MGFCNNSIIDVASDRGSIYLGVWDTLNVRQQQFDVSAWLDAYGDDGVLTVLNQRRTDELPYEVADVVVENGVATWTFDETDTAVVGEGKAALVYIRAGETIARTVPFATYTAPTIGMTGVEPPDPWEAWYTRILEESAAAQQAARDAAASASSASTDAETARIRAEQALTARNQALEARNEARSARDEAQAARGEAVTAAGTATGAAETATTAAGTATGAAETATTAASGAVTAQGKAETAQGKAEIAQAAAEAAETAAEATVLSAFATETQTAVEIVTTQLAADALPFKTLTVDIGCKQEGSGDPTPTNIRAISGRTSVEIIVSPSLDPTAGTTTTISLASVTGGVYLARLNVLTGELKIFGFKRTMDGSQGNRLSAFTQTADASVGFIGVEGTNKLPEIWKRAYIKSNMFKYSAIYDQAVYTFGGNRGANQSWMFGIPRNGTLAEDIAAFNTAMQTNPVEFVATYAAPLPTVQLTPAQVVSILGSMNVWCSAGKVSEATYRLDPTLVYNSLRG